MAYSPRLAVAGLAQDFASQLGEARQIPADRHAIGLQRDPFHERQHQVRLCLVDEQVPHRVESAQRQDDACFINGRVATTFSKLMLSPYSRPRPSRNKAPGPSPVPGALVQPAAS